jgi:two-component system response regulator YesN
VFSVLLVEDEKFALETLQKYINWQKLSINSVHTARNGRRALEIIEEHDIDIMITDIQMPVMNGIELAKTVRKENIKTKIVFLTGYDDFDYIKTAFHVQAFDYILKPFAVEDIEKLIVRIEEQLTKDRAIQESVSMATRQVFEQWVTGCLSEEEVHTYVLPLHEFQQREPEYGLLAVYGVQNENLLQADGSTPLEIIHTFLKKHMLTVILNESVHFEDSVSRISTMLDGAYSIAYFRSKMTLRLMKKRYELLKSLADTLFYAERGNIIDADNISDILIPTQPDTTFVTARCSEMKKWIICGDKEKTKIVLESIYGECKKGTKKECIRSLYGIWVELENSLVLPDEQLADWMRKTQEKWGEKISASCYYSVLCETVSSYIDRILLFFVNQHRNPAFPVILKIRHYVEQHYSGVCRIDEIAEEVHLSPNYVRNIFKENTGQTILEYVTDYRMNKACYFLKNKTLKIKEISRQVGYENLSYFCSVFTKRYGVSPNEYRKMV